MDHAYSKTLAQCGTSMKNFIIETLYCIRRIFSCTNWHSTYERLLPFNTHCLYNSEILQDISEKLLTEKNMLEDKW